MTIATADLCDAHEESIAAGTLRVLAPGLRAYGGVTAFAGAAETLRLCEDNTLVRPALEEPGAGRVLVIDGAGSLRCALVGGNLAQLAARNGWAGILVNGAVRDVLELDACAIGIRALGTHPMRSRKRNSGERGCPVMFPGAVIRPGNWIYADADGVLVSDTPLT